MPAPVLVKVIIGGIGIVVAALAARGERRKHARLLRMVAERRGGTVSELPLQLELRDNGVRIEVRVWTVKNGGFTGYWAHLPAPGTAWFKIAPSSFGNWVTTMLGAQDITLGDEAFDRHYVVKAKDPDTVRRVWPIARANELVQLAKAEIESDGSVVHLLEQRIGSVQQIEAGIDLLLRVAAADPYGLASLRTLPEAVMVHRSRFPYAEMPGPQPILVGPSERDGVAITLAWTTAVGSHEGELPPAAASLLETCGGTLEHGVDDTRVWWPRIETDPQRLLAAVELLRVLGRGPSLGVFR